MDVPVIVAGGGPVGLATAFELQARGVDVLLVERNPSTTRHPKMDVTNGRSMEIFRRLGIAEAIRDVAVSRSNPMDVVWVTRLAEWELARFHYPNVDEVRALIKERNDGSQPLEPNMRLSQVVLEPKLKEFLEKCPRVEMRFGWAFEGFEEDDEAVTVKLREVASDKIEYKRCALLAGCDGGGSLTREQLGFSWQGNLNVARFYMVHFHSDATDLLQNFGIAWHYQSPLGSTLIAQDDKQIWTIHCILPEDVDASSIEPERLVFEALGREFPIEVIQANPWSAHLVCANGYGHGRVWMAGDSVHQVIPTGGYGMNTGMGDAADLAWKYAAVLEGWGGPKLLTSIDTERRPVGERIIEASGTHMRTRLRIAEAYNPMIHEDSVEGAQARANYGKLIQDLGNLENEAHGIELGYRYRSSPIICHEDDEPQWQVRSYVPSTWPGVRAPHVFLESGTAIFDLFGPWFTLIRFTDASPEPLLHAASERNVPLTLLDIKEQHVRGIYERDFVLIRPDQHVAWRGNTMPEDPFAVIDRIRGATE
ncbi:2-polyprenyl-6-methoxyphenol hydroxylase-like FAD-dependent oxidoreductase [Sphingobium xenophagum]|uniref:2-polyprenyl-6-methoxyphenol hydroxylase-like FAD-dependent oxidoreductase n=1 Tax=Sphingobium xenophagum TaxID=121428 RepID=A0ABU1X6C5_SPHXE|nr:2-polyprenyl-6-methoxyphenol hydroxylase-like FAD-dependent oxidoreductase [Sphingobium xenophagum]